MIWVLSQDADPDMFRPTRGLECFKPIIRLGMTNPSIICKPNTLAQFWRDGSRENWGPTAG